MCQPTKPINRPPWCCLRLVNQRRAGVTEIKSAKPKDGRLCQKDCPEVRSPQAAAGPLPMPGAGEAGGGSPAPSRLRLRLLPLTVEEERERESLPCPLRVSSGTSRERRMGPCWGCWEGSCASSLLPCRRGAEEPSAKRGQSRAEF